MMIKYIFIPKEREREKSLNCSYFNAAVSLLSNIFYKLAIFCEITCQINTSKTNDTTNLGSVVLHDVPGNQEQSLLRIKLVLDISYQSRT